MKDHIHNPEGTSKMHTIKESAKPVTMDPYRGVKFMENLVMDTTISFPKSPIWWIFSDEYSSIKDERGDDLFIWWLNSLP